MTVWIVNPFDNLPTEGYRPQRYWLMARAFSEAGHRVTYWSSDFSHAHKAPRRCDKLVERQGFRLTLVPTRPYPSTICLRRVWSHGALARTGRQMAFRYVRLEKGGKRHVARTRKASGVRLPAQGMELEIVYGPLL